MHTHQIPPGCSLHEATSAPIWRLPAASRTWACRPPGRHTTHDTHIACTHDTGDLCAPIVHEQKSARTSALHLHGRRTCAGSCCSGSGRLTSSCGPLDGRLAPTLAPTARRRRHAALSAARGPMAAAAAAAAAELLGSAPTMAAAADKEHVRLERETPISAPAGSRGRPHGRTPAEGTERGGARGGLAACRHRRLVALLSRQTALASARRARWKSGLT